MGKKDQYIKKNNSAYPDSLIQEAKGLSTLRELLVQSANEKLHIPEVFSVDEQQLVMEQVPNTYATKAQQQLLGEGLAELHSVPQDSYGFSENNYIGLNPQKNILSQNWGRFFVDYRLKFQIGLIENVAIKHEFSNSLLKSEKALIHFLNENCAFPSLLHGDLWQGNVLFSRDHEIEKVWLIDPAVYYGDREVDIAMTEMFGGFERDFYQAYENVLALTEYYPEKRVIYNLYHYLNHYSLFGSAYLSACEKGIEFINRFFD